jgi:hypothetical protein
MAKHLQARHAITIGLPVAQCQKLFTPAGEELWIDDWKPTYHHPADGRTQRGMIFSTGSGEDLTLWSLVDYEDGEYHRARYMRVTPALRSGYVEVTCAALSPQTTKVEVSYELTALTPDGERSLQAYEPAPFVAMIEEWARLIEARLPVLAAAEIG